MNDNQCMRCGAILPRIPTSQGNYYQVLCVTCMSACSSNAPQSFQVNSSAAGNSTCPMCNGKGNIQIDPTKS